MAYTVIILDLFDDQDRLMKLTNADSGPDFFWSEPYDLIDDDPPGSFSVFFAGRNGGRWKLTAMDDLRQSILEDPFSACGHYSAEFLGPPEQKNKRSRRVHFADEYGASSAENTPPVRKSRDTESTKHRTSDTVNALAKPNGASGGNSKAAQVASNKKQTNNVVRAGPGNDVYRADPDSSRETKYDQDRRREEQAVAKLSQEYDLKLGQFYKLKPDMQFSSLDCRLLALLDAKYGKPIDWTTLQGDFMKATGKWLVVDTLKCMLRDAKSITGPDTDDYTFADCRVVAYLAEQMEDKKWPSITTEFRAATGRGVEMEVLKRKFAKENNYL
ncbi:hypothetical protein GE09DRAFT_1222792 [Coniochaeta sp. 2T2.1]|nr:hypothetical protein GE09DRAFT_1222792 [Coniochaeta sp. 2T2.1]